MRPGASSGETGGMLIFEIFEQVPDPRKPGHAIQHLFLDVLCIALCAMLSGAEGFEDMAEGFEDMEDYGRAKEKWLREHLGLALPNGIPSHDTFTTPSIACFPA